MTSVADATMVSYNRDGQRDFLSDGLSVVPHFVKQLRLFTVGWSGSLCGRSSLFLVFEDGDCFLRSDHEVTYSREPFEVPPLPTLR
jgi:hypothetical protein